MSAAAIDLARRQLGTLEVPRNSNRTPYGKAYGWDGVAWCMIFAWWVLTTAGQGHAVPKTAGTVVARDWYIKRKQWLDGPNADARPGDLVFFKFPGNGNVVNHVGIVEAVEPNGLLITIEGNTAGTNAGDQRNGGGVFRRRRTRAQVVGFARPAYTDLPPGPTPALPASRPVLREGARGDAVKLVQRAVGVAADGIFGPATKRAVIAYQRRHGLGADGVVGPRTWAKIGA